MERSHRGEGVEDNAGMINVMICGDWPDGLKYTCFFFF